MRFSQDEIRSRKLRVAKAQIDAPQKKGKSHRMAYLHGERDLTLLQAVQSHCWECNGFHSADEGGELDCLVVECSLYPFQPYQQHVVRKKRASTNKGRNKSVPNTGNLSQT